MQVLQGAATSEAQQPIVLQGAATSKAPDMACHEDNDMLMTQDNENGDEACENADDDKPLHHQDIMEESGVDLDGRRLPAGWKNEEHQGQRLYVDHKNRRFSYVHPADLPRNDQDAMSPITNSAPGTAHVPGSSLNNDDMPVHMPVDMPVDMALDATP